MSGDWLKMELNTPDKPEVWAMANELNIDPDAVVGKLFRVWGWFDQHSEKGNSPIISKLLLDRLVGVSNFTESMISVGWMVQSDTEISLPNFDRHNGESGKKRADAARRKAKSRAGVKSTNVTKSCDIRHKISRPLRSKILKRDNEQCVYCGFTEDKKPSHGEHSTASISIDHVLPVSKGGEDLESNLVACCTVCNNYKNNRTPSEAGMTAMYVTKECDISVTNALPREEKRREDIKENKKKKTVGFIPPSVQQVAEYIESKKLNIDADYFVNHYEANGWMRGKNKIKDWKACVRTWKGNQQNKNNQPAQKQLSEFTQ